MRYQAGLEEVEMVSFFANGVGYIELFERLCTSFFLCIVEVICIVTNNDGPIFSVAVLTINVGAVLSVGYDWYIMSNSAICCYIYVHVVVGDEGSKLLTVGKGGGDALLQPLDIGRGL